MNPRTRILLPVSAAVSLGVASGLYVWRRTTTARRQELSGDEFGTAARPAASSLPSWAGWGVNEAELFRDPNHLPH